MTFNPQAVLGYTPAVYEGVITVDSPFGPTTSSFTAERLQNSGRYALYASGYVTQLKERAKILGIEPKSRMYAHEDVCRLLHSFDVSFNPNDHGQTLERCALFELQVKVLGSGNPAPPEFLRAQLEFEVMADSLLKQVQAQVYPSFKITTISNPLRARALGKRREGVFLWPDWKDPRYVNLVMGCEPAVHSQVRDLVLDWSETNKVRLNPRTAF